MLLEGDSIIGVCITVAAYIVLHYATLTGCIKSDNNTAIIYYDFHPAFVKKERRTAGSTFFFLDVIKFDQS